MAFSYQLSHGKTLGMTHLTQSQVENLSTVNCNT